MIFPVGCAVRSGDSTNSCGKACTGTVLPRKRPLAVCQKYISTNHSNELFLPVI